MVVLIACVAHADTATFRALGTCPDERHQLPDCTSCIPGLRGAHCNKQLTTATEAARSYARRHAVRRYGKDVAPFELYQYLSHPDLASRHAITGQWMVQTKPRAILDIGPYVSPILRWLRHCPEQVVAVEPCGELTTHNASQPFISTYVECPADRTKRMIYTVAPITIRELLALPSTQTFDAVVCMGCDAGFGPTAKLLSAFRIRNGAFDLYLEHPSNYALSVRMAKSLISLPGCTVTADARILANVSSTERYSNDRHLRRLRYTRLEDGARTTAVNVAEGRALTQANHVAAEVARHLGPWKMTYASSKPEAARTFIVRLLGATPTLTTVKRGCADSASHGLGASIQWAEFRAGRTAAPRSESRSYYTPPPTAFARNMVWQLHFVRHYHRPAGPMAVELLERTLERHRHEVTNAQAKGPNSQSLSLLNWDPFLDFRVVMEAPHNASIAPIAARLLRQRVVHMVRKLDDGRTSLIVPIPNTTSALELVGDTDELVQPRRWSRCEDASLTQREPIINWKDVSANARRPSPPLHLSRIVYASSEPQAAASRMADFLPGARLGRIRRRSQTTAFTTSDPEADAACTESHFVHWAGAPGVDGFGMQWIDARRSRDAARQLSSAPRQQMPLSTGEFLGQFERYVARLHGNLSQRTSNDWDYWMDNHFGMFIDDCGPLLKALRGARAPHFVVPHFKRFLAVFISDPMGSNLVEAMCHKFDRELFRKAPEWNFCEDPSPREDAAGLESPLVGGIL
jgi:hypothetical protein